MRQRFEQQMSLRTLAISEVKFPLKSRDELPPVLMALQYIFVTPELNKKVFELLEKKIGGGKKKTGRKGMPAWPDGQGSLARAGACCSSSCTGH